MPQVGLWGPSISMVRVGVKIEPYELSVTLSSDVALGRSIGPHLELELELELSNLTRTFEEMKSDKARQAAERRADIVGSIHEELGSVD